MNKHMSLRSGKTLWSGYRLKRVLGQGAFGQVWETRDANDAPLAMKFMRCGSDLAAAQEIRNIQNVQQVKHDHLIRIDRVWADQGYLVVVMELADGSLHDLLSLCRKEYGTPMPADLVLFYLTQAATVLDHLNARRHTIGAVQYGIQHCDVKPSNLLLCGETIKLSDFGLSTTMTSLMTQHRRAGTLAYAAPEIFQGRLSQWSDQYALAVTYCELRGGRRPFAEPDAGYAADYRRPDPDLTMLPAAERPILARALDPTPTGRWPSCLAWLHQLAKVEAKTPA